VSLPPGVRIGILGGGQLGRMSAMAAARLGYRAHVFAPEADGPGLQVAAERTIADYRDEAALARFAAAVDVVTFEFENVPAEALSVLAGRVDCRPGAAVLATCQDRLAEKAFLRRVGVPVAPFAAVSGAADLSAALAVVGLPAVLKTTRLGYDGRGQAVVRTAAEAEAAVARLAPAPFILEAFVPFSAEVSALVARGADGAAVVHDVAANSHAHHILDRSVAPARIPPGSAAAAQAHARAVAEGLGLVGVAAVEFFLLPDGTLLGNEIAPRPHNSFHWTIEACRISQFEAHIRAVAGLPLPDPGRHHDATMQNLVGPEGMDRLPALLADPAWSVHLYGKAEARPGRKMGHATRLWPLGAGEG
jgi:5-(carboxyamino)imidazole ribonucleotide synthase